MELNVYNEQGQQVGTVVLDDVVLRDGIRYRLLAEVVRMYQARTRRGTRSTKTRAERRGGGRKPWRQKGTGRARHGSRRSPIWRKGGIVFGPRPQEFSYSLPRKALRQALRSAICGKLIDQEVKVLEDLTFEQPKTRRAAAMLGALGLAGKKALLVPPAPDPVLHKSCRNIPGTVVTPLAELNAYSVLTGGCIVFLRSAVQKLPELLRV